MSVTFTIAQLPLATQLGGAEVVAIDCPNGNGTFTTRKATLSQITQPAASFVQYLTIPGQTNVSSRALAFSSEFAATDGGLGANYAVALSATGVTAGAYDGSTAALSLTVDAKGRITSIATSALVYAPLASPAFTGVPTAPTATAGTNTTQVATTAFVTTATVGFAPLASPSFTGSPAAPTATSSDSSTRIATTAFVKTQGYASMVSPNFTGTPTAPTASAGTNTTQLATTAFATGAISTAVTPLAPLASPTFTGTPTVPTAAAGTNTTQAASTAFVTGTLTTLGVTEIPFMGQDIRALYLILAGQAGIDRLNGVSTIADSFSDQSDIDTASCVNQVYDGTNLLYSPTNTIGSALSMTGAAISGGDAASHAAGLAFDGNTATFWRASQAAGSTSGVSYIGMTFATPIDLRKFVYTASPNVNATALTVNIDYLADDGTTWVTALSSTTLSGSASAVTTTNVPASGFHASWRMMAASNPTVSPWEVAELVFYGATYSAMTLQSKSFASDISSPTKARLLLQVAPTANQPITLNSDLIGSVSRDNGVDFTAGTLAYVETMADGTKTYETGLVDISAQGAGSSMRYRAVTANNKNVKIAGAVLQWRA